MLKKLHFKSWLLMLCMLVGVGNVWAQTDPYYTLDTTGSTQTSNNGYDKTGTVTVSNIEWSFEGNGKINPWRLGGKSITEVDRIAKTNTAMASAISQVVLTVGTASDITVNSLKLTVSSDADFTTVLDEVTTTFVASSDITFVPSTGTEWATGAYYKFTFNVTVSETSNKFVQFSRVKFYAPEGAGDTRTSVTLSFAEASYSATLGETFTAPTLTVDPTEASSEVKYSSSNPTVATVNGAVVSLLTAGTTIITASISESENYKDAEASYTLKVKNAPVEGQVVDELTRETTGIENGATTYSDWSDKSVNTAVYAGNSAGSNNAIQLRSNNNNSGIVTTTSGGVAVRVEVEWQSETVDGRTIDIYGSNSAYTSPTELYNTASQGDKLGSIIKGTSTSLDIEGPDTYKYIGIRSNNNALYLSSVSITWDTETVTKEDAELSFSESTCTATIGEENTFPTLSNPHSLSVTYSSLNEEVATIAADGTITLVAAGRTTITASSEETTIYSAGSASYTLTVADPNIPGQTQGNPYTVAQALAASPAEGVYVRGIISQIDEVSTDHGNATYWISDNGETTTQIKIYRGNYVGNASFTSADQIQVGDEVVITGNLSVYSGANQMAQGNYLVSLNRPVNTDPVINAENVTIEYNETSGVVAYTIENPVAGTSLTVTTDVDWISNITVGEESLTFTVTKNEGEEDRIAEITLIYGDLTKEVTVTQKHFVVDYAELPFVYDGNGSGALPTGLTQSGLGTYDSSPAMKFDNTGDYLVLKFNKQPGTLTFDILGNSFSGGTFKVQTSVDGVTYTDLETYTTGLTSTKQSEKFDNIGATVRYIKWVYTEKASGNVALGNIKLDRKILKGDVNEDGVVNIADVTALVNIILGKTN